MSVPIISKKSLGKLISLLKQNYLSICELVQGPRSNFEIGGGTISDSILGGGHKTIFLTNSL